MSSHRAARVIAAIVLLSTSLIGCDPRARRDAEALRAELEQMRAVSAEKDSLLLLVTENTRVMSDIGAELSKVKGLKAGGVTPVSPEGGASYSYRDSLLSQVREVTERVNQAEQRLQASQSRIRALSRQSDTLTKSMALIQTTITELQSVIQNQRTTITSLTDQLNTLQLVNEQLTEEKAAIADTASRLAQKDRTVYYVIGTKDELKERGLVVEEGGTRFLFFGSRALQPARDLDPAAFTAIDKLDMAEIPLPRADKKYKIVSRQNVAYLTSPPDKDGKLAGAIQIAAPEEFWAPSKFLIVVQQ